MSGTQQQLEELSNGDMLPAAQRAAQFLSVERYVCEFLYHEGEVQQIQTVARVDDPGSHQIGTRKYTSGLNVGVGR